MPEQKLFKGSLELCEILVIFPVFKSSNKFTDELLV